MNESLKRLTLIAGPLLAGTLIAAVGPTYVLWLDAATFALSAALIALRIPSAVQTRSRGSDSPLMSGGMIAGIRFILDDRPLRSLMATMAIVYAIGTSLLTVVMPVFSKQVYDNATALGLLLSGFAGGTLIGTVIYGVVGYSLRRLLVFRSSLLLAGLPLIVLAASPALSITFIALTVRGLMFGPVNPLVMTVYQERIPPSLRGRVLGAYFSATAGTVAIGFGVSGYAIEAIGLQQTLLAMAITYLSVSLLSLGKAVSAALEANAVNLTMTSLR